MLYFPQSTTHLGKAATTNKTRFRIVTIQVVRFVGATLVVALYLWGQPQGLPLRGPLYLYLYTLS